MVVEGDALYLYGGHSVAIEADKSEVETVYDDMWRLDLKTYQVRPPSPSRSRRFSSISQWFLALELYPSQSEILIAQCATRDSICNRMAFVIPACAINGSLDEGLVMSSLSRLLSCILSYRV